MTITIASGLLMILWVVCLRKFSSLTWAKMVEYPACMTASHFLLPHFTLTLTECPTPVTKLPKYPFCKISYKANNCDVIYYATVRNEHQFVLLGIAMLQMWVEYWRHWQRLVWWHFLHSLQVNWGLYWYALYCMRLTYHFTIASLCLGSTTDRCAPSSNKMWPSVMVVYEDASAFAVLTSTHWCIIE